jgi:hypothetical protein
MDLISSCHSDDRVGCAIASHCFAGNIDHLGGEYRHAARLGRGLPGCPRVDRQRSPHPLDYRRALARPHPPPPSRYRRALATGPPGGAGGGAARRRGPWRQCWSRGPIRCRGILATWWWGEARVCAEQATFRRVCLYGLIKLRLSSGGGQPSRWADAFAGPNVFH